MLLSIVNGKNRRTFVMKTPHLKLCNPIDCQNSTKSPFHGVVREYILRLPSNKMNKIKQVNATIPNIIHSLDASHLYKVIDLMAIKNIHQFITIHDCFGSHPNNIEIMSKLVKISFIEMYSNPEYIVP